MTVIKNLLNFKIKKTKILLIDHNDSFTFNIVEIFRTLNLEVTVINYSDINIKEIDKFDKIILSPGPMLPENYPKTKEVIKIYCQTKSFLGICLGHQALCEFFNAKLKNLDQVFHGLKQEVNIVKNNGLFKNLPSKINVGLYHSWFISSSDLPTELEITSQTNKGVIMSFKHTKYAVYGIQFHPESFLTPYGKEIIKNFIEL